METGERHKQACKLAGLVVVYAGYLRHIGIVEMAALQPIGQGLLVYKQSGKIAAVHWAHHSVEIKWNPHNILYKMNSKLLTRRKQHILTNTSEEGF